MTQNEIVNFAGWAESSKPNNPHPNFLPYEKGNMRLDSMTYPNYIKRLKTWTSFARGNFNNSN